MRRQQGRGDFASLADVKHLAQRLLRQYKHRGAPVVLTSGSWTEGERQAVLKRGPHRSATEHTLFLRVGVCLDGIKRSVGGASLIGSQGASGTSADPAGRESGAGSEALLDRQL